MDVIDFITLLIHQRHELMYLLMSLTNKTFLVYDLDVKLKKNQSQVLPKLPKAHEYEYTRKHEIPVLPTS